MSKVRTYEVAVCGCGDQLELENDGTFEEREDGLLACPECEAPYEPVTAIDARDVEGLVEALRVAEARISAWEESPRLKSPTLSMLMVEALNEIRAALDRFDSSTQEGE